MNRRSRTLGVLVAVGLVTTLGACGDDGDERTESISKSAYVERANAICIDTSHQGEVAHRRIIGDSEPSAALAQEFLAEVAEIISSNVDRRAAIPAPEGDDATVEAITAAGREAAAGFEEAASSGDTALAVMRGIAPDPADGFDRLSAEYGLTECAGAE